MSSSLTAASSSGSCGGLKKLKKLAHGSLLVSILGGPAGLPFAGFAFFFITCTRQPHHSLRWRGEHVARTPANAFPEVA